MKVYKYLYNYCTDMKKHKHHIIPRHMGGTNDKSNLIELTIEEHAEAHRILHEKYGKWQDFVAWKALSGQISSDEARRLLVSLLLKGKPKNEEHAAKCRVARLGKKHSEETKKKMSESQTGRKITWDLKATTPEANEKRSKSLTGRPKPVTVCPHCNKSGGVPQMKQWHFNNCKEKK